ncbi:MAG: hypothetical protein ACYCYP_09120 [Leptospirales bacterium]
MERTLETLKTLYALHDRSYQDNRYVYPVLSRRAGGISVGINLNPDKGCNFDCVYCQVDRTPSGMTGIDPVHRPTDIPLLLEELDRITEEISSGALFSRAPFEGVPENLRKMADIALSGDGEPTMVPEFLPVLDALLEHRSRKTGLLGIPIRLITNGTGLFRRSTRRALGKRFFPGGAPTPQNDEVWFKIDAADTESFRRIDQSSIPFDRYWSSVSETLLELPVTIQTMVCEIQNPRSPFDPLGEWRIQMVEHIRNLLSQGALIREWHLYTVARKTPDPSVLPLSPEGMECLRLFFQKKIALPIRVFS